MFKDYWSKVARHCAKIEEVRLKKSFLECFTTECKHPRVILVRYHDGYDRMHCPDCLNTDIIKQH